MLLAVVGHPQKLDVDDATMTSIRYNLGAMDGRGLSSRDAKEERLSLVTTTCPHLYAVAWLHALELCCDACSTSSGDRIEVYQGGIAHEIGNVIGDFFALLGDQLWSGRRRLL
jgi:hypothetical protein